MRCAKGSVTQQQPVMPSRESEEVLKDCTPEPPGEPCPRMPA